MISNKQTAFLGLLNNRSRQHAPAQADPEVAYTRKKWEPCTPPDTPDPGCEGPTTLIELLCQLMNEQIQVIIPFGAITGTLIAVKIDYIVMIESTGEQVLVNLDKIEMVSKL